jgi:hypothetical protein
MDYDYPCVTTIIPAAPGTKAFVVICGDDAPICERVPVIAWRIDSLGKDSDEHDVSPVLLYYHGWNHSCHIALCLDNGNVVDFESGVIFEKHEFVAAVTPKRTPR